MHYNTGRLSAIILFILLLCPIAQVASAQNNPFGFSMFNERNHPQIKWMSAETEHFIITYPDHLSGIEAEAAAIAEASYHSLSENLNVTFDYKIRIYLSDEDEIVNGFAVPFNRAYTNIWVNLNDVAQDWSGSEKWLRTVIAHELAHIFHFEAVKSGIPLIGILGIAPSLPEPWTEGLAQYLTEPWHVLRGDAILRTSIYDGRPSHRDGSSIRNRGLMYAAGNSQLRYFASTYGDSLLPQIFAHRSDMLFGLFKYHGFREAFKEKTGKDFREFEDEWRRHVSIYYHTLAGQMERTDSLGVKADSIAGMFVSDVKYSPDASRFAVVSFVSEERPFNRLMVVDNDDDRRTRVLVDGSIRSQVAWSADGKYLVYAALRRGRYGSIINDLYKVDVESARRERLTDNRRAVNPAMGKDDRVFYVVNENGTGNIFSRGLHGGDEQRHTSYSGDVQIGKTSMHPDGISLAYALFDADGSRYIVVLDTKTGDERRFTDPGVDDRNPIWSPDGKLMAYNSMRDYVANVFIIDPFDGVNTEERVTALFTGGLLADWIPADSTYASGRLVLITNDAKRYNRVYNADASRRAVEPQPDINPSYTRWLTHLPKNALPVHIEKDASLISDRYAYNSWSNISHVATIPFPYYSSEDNYGLGFVTIFSEPLSKHMFTGVGAISFNQLADNSLVFLGYTNNQLQPSISLNAYHNSFTGRIYERDVLVTRNSGAFLLASLPRDWVDSPFVNTTLYGRLRYEHTDASWNWSALSAPSLGLPEDGWQSDIRLGFRINKSKPYAHNIIHPLEGWGIETRLSVATKAMGGDTEFVRPDIMAYAVLPALGGARFYLYGRAIAQWGDAFAQDYIGFSRFDDVQFGASLPGLDFLYSDTERVRGFSDYIVGNRMLFGTIEYRVPFLPSLETRLLGLIDFGMTSIAAFLDGGMVWVDGFSPGEDAVKRAGTGFEIKNVLSLGILSFTHSLGFAQPVPDFGGGKNQEIYYRIRAVVPF